MRCTVFLCFTHKSTCTKDLVSAFLGLGERPGHSRDQKMAPESAPKRAPNMPPKQGARERVKKRDKKCPKKIKSSWRKLGFGEVQKMSVAGMDSGLYARHGAPCLVETWRALLGAFFGHIFRRICRRTSGRIFRRNVQRACGRINRQDQPTANKQQTTCR